MRLLPGLIWLLVLMFIVVPGGFCENTPNSLKAVTAKVVDGQTRVDIVTDQPVGYRYTVYDSIDPVRIVVDFPRMSFGDMESPILVGKGGIQEIRLSTFDLSLGTLVRVEVLLDAPVNYKTNFSENDMTLTFSGGKGSAAVAALPAADKVAADKLAAEKLASEKLAAEKLAAEKLAAEKLAAEKLAAEKLAAQKLAAQKLAAEKLAAEKLAAEKLAAEKLAADKLAADKLAADKLAADKLAADKLAADKLAADKLAADKLAADKLAAKKAAAVKQATERQAAEKQAVVTPVAVTPAAVAAVAVPAAVEKPATQNASQASIQLKGNQVEISASSGIERLRYFTLDNPKRLVVDLFGVTVAGKKREYPLEKGFSKLRVGPYADKLRFVFDSTGAELPLFSVNRVKDTVEVAWTDVVPPVVQTPTPSAAPEEAVVSSIDFSVAGGKSEYRIKIDGPVEVAPVVKEGSILKFGLKNTAISRSLRRVYTAMAFPTAVQSVTPYLIDNGQSSDVRFVVQLKGDVPYELLTEKNEVVLSISDGRFAEPEPADVEMVPVKVNQPAQVSNKPAPANMAPAAKPAGPAEVTIVAAESPKAELQTHKNQNIVEVSSSPIVNAGGKTGEFSGEKISLVFDSISVRNVLQLIAEVSNLNIIASDQIKGDVTLRLTDVPWDQALGLVLDITNLGMIQEGNVVRVLPKDVIRSMREAELTAVRSQEKLEPTVTEVITVSYADLGAVSAPSKDLLSDRGSITDDARNKLLIVSDVPARIEKIRELVKILDTPERQVMIEARIVEVNSNYSRDLGVNWGLDFNNPGNKLGSAQLGVGGDFTVGLPAGGGSASTEAGLGAGITFGRIGIDQTVLDLRISALESNGNAKIVSTPRVTTLNGEEATISQGTTIPYQTSGADGPKTEFIAAELKLTVKPVINPDNSVILEILATNDSPSITAGASAPSIDTKKAETKVLVMDGETTVIGGIFINNKSESETGTPILMSIPVLGHLFKSTKVTDTKAELMIFITPHILNNN